MKKRRIKLKSRIYPVIWSGIIVIAIYLLVCFAAYPFSNNMGQAKLSMTDAFFSKLYCKILEDSSSLISYSNETEERTQFPMSVVANEFALEEFTTENEVMTAKAADYGELLTQSVDDDAKEAVQTMGTDKVLNEVGYYQIKEGVLSTEYILTNGAIFNSNMASNRVKQGENTEQLQLDYSKGEVYYEETEDSASFDGGEALETANTGGAVKYTMKQLQNINFLVQNFYIVDKSTKVTESLFDAKELLAKDMTLKQTKDAPQILIYHTHSQEAYIDSRQGKEEDTVVGVGSYLADILKEEYDYNVLHDTKKYDIVDGKLNRNVAYDKAEKGVSELLKKNPSIEVVIDLHRDEGNARTIKMNGKETANIMLFNGLSRDQNGPITYLDNPNLQDNLAFSLQLQLKSKSLYPGLFYRNYLKSYRFNLHLRPKSLLIELGTVENTLQSALNAMVPFAEVLDEVLKGK